MCIVTEGKVQKIGLLQVHSRNEAEDLEIHCLQLFMVAYPRNVFI